VTSAKKIMMINLYPFGICTDCAPAGTFIKVVMVNFNFMLILITNSTLSSKGYENSVQK